MSSKEQMNRLNKQMKSNLESHSKSRLIEEIQKNNVRGYSKLKKPELIKLMMNERNIEKFRYIKDKKLEEALKAQESKPTPKPKPKKPAPKPTPKPTPKPAPKPAVKQTPKPAFMKVKEDIDELKGIIKKSYENNKKKLSKMTPKKYEDTTEKKLDTFIDDDTEIYKDYNFSISQTNIDDLEKYFFSVVPKKQTKPKPTPKKKSK